MCLGEIRVPPHQNSVLLAPCKKIAAIQGHRPGRESSPPTTLYLAYSGWPQSVIQLFEFICIVDNRLEIPSGSTTFSTGVKTDASVTVCGGGAGVADTVVSSGGTYCTGPDVSAGGIYAGVVVSRGPERGQHTPGTKRLLKQRDWRKLLRLRSNCGQSLKSSQYLKHKGGHSNKGNI